MIKDGGVGLVKYKVIYLELLQMNYFALIIVFDFFEHWRISETSHLFDSWGQGPLEVNVVQGADPEPWCTSAVTREPAA